MARSPAGHRHTGIPSGDAGSARLPGTLLEEIALLERKRCLGCQNQAAVCVAPNRSTRAIRGARSISTLEAIGEAMEFSLIPPHSPFMPLP